MGIDVSSRKILHSLSLHLHFYDSTVRCPSHVAVLNDLVRPNPDLAQVLLLVFSALRPVESPLRLTVVPVEALHYPMEPVVVVPRPREDRDRPL